MAWTADLTEMLAELRRRGGYRRSTSLTDAILTGFLNSGIAAVHDLIVKHNPDFLVKSVDIDTVADVATVPLPADFYKARRVDLVDGSTTVRLRPCQMDDELRTSEATVWSTASGLGRPRYLLQAGRIKLVPTPSSVYTLRLWYIPHATKMVAATAATLDLGPLTTNLDTVVAAAIAGEDGNDITLAFVADGTTTGQLDENAFPDVVFHYASGVTTVGDFEAAVGASDRLAISSLDGTAATALAAPGDTFAATGFTGGVGAEYDGVNGHEDLVYEHALRYCKVRDRQPTGEHDDSIMRLEKRLLFALESRDQSEPVYLADLGRGEEDVW